MDVIYSNQPFPSTAPSIFLAGPNPHEFPTISWRQGAIQILSAMGFDGAVYIPEFEDGIERFSLPEQFEWQLEGLERASAILFWVPRHPENLPAFTTNVEFGRYAGSGRAVYGRPEGRPFNEYLDWLYTKLTGQRPCFTLPETLAAAVKLAQANTKTSFNQGTIKGAHLESESVLEGR